ncbi:MAG: DNA repair protein RadC [Anaerovibrio sp.]|uniref:RadC family protein n=1 Tax=Anaerovibrio sp. TaxID=1872532 RepID=UPI0025F95BCE|nr:DNA repair protein RadC [Anaerovibrio sp.]MCR5175264.1 DNA repair protein RadC [Anaerovibrio sp.]
MTMVKDLPVDDRPRERLIAHGPGILSNAELLAILLGSGSKEKSAMQLAQELLSQHRESGVSALASMSAEELTAHRGIGNAKAALLLAAVELGKRLEQHTAVQRPVVRCPADAADYAMPRLRYQQREHFAVILLNIKHHILSMPIISIGSLTASVAHPREVFKAAVQNSAAAVILVHNHPSGDPSPSKEDISVTQQMVRAGKLMDIPVLDHIVLGDNKYISLKEEGMIQ